MGVEGRWRLLAFRGGALGSCPGLAPTSGLAQRGTPRGTGTLGPERPGPALPEPRGPLLGCRTQPGRGERGRPSPTSRRVANAGDRGGPLLPPPRGNPRAQEARQPPSFAPQGHGHSTPAHDPKGKPRAPSLQPLRPQHGWRASPRRWALGGQLPRGRRSGTERAWPSLELTGHGEPRPLRHLVPQGSLRPRRRLPRAPSARTRGRSPWRSCTACGSWRRWPAPTPCWP